MAWRDRLRRRTAVPEAANGRAAEPSAPSGGAPSGGAAAASQAAAPVTGVPGDWDGGWRMTAQPVLTVSRAAIGVSDGLAFRSGLAAWRDPSFDTGMGHAVLPSAPAGLVGGVTRPAGALPTPAPSGGGPLLLRALRQPQEAEPPAAGDTPQTARRGRPEAPSPSRASSSRATASRPGSPGTRGASTHSAAVLGTPAPAVQRAVAAELSSAWLADGVERIARDWAVEHGLPE
ncbi:hypothetical protein ABT234_16765, partial [Streptomyces sp. NPDC001586]